MNEALETSAHNAMVVSNIDTSNIETFGRRSTGSLGNVGGQRPSFDSTYARPSTRPSYDTNVNTRPSYDSNANTRASKSDINTSSRTSYSNDTNTNTRTSYSNDTNVNIYPRPKPYEPKRETETDSYVRTTTTTTATTTAPTTTSNSTKSYNVPKSLGAEAGDLMDIMGALGDSSMGIGNTITINRNQYTNYNLALGSGLDNSSIVDDDDDDDDNNTMSVESRLKNLVKSSLLDSPHR